jgi:hypothetical protein
MTTKTSSPIETCPALGSTTGAAAQIPRAHISLGAGRVKGNAETPLIMNRKIRRPARASHAAGAGWASQSTPHLGERCLRILLAETGIRGVRRGQSTDEKHR